MRAVGPDAPTLCEGWTTRDLAAHLLVRERRPVASVGISVPLLAEYSEKVRISEAARPWEGLLNDISSGPPLLSPFRLVDRWANLGEMFIHHEDVLRGGADPDGLWSPRELSPGLEEALLAQLKVTGRMILRSSPVRVTLRTDTGADVLTVGSGGPVVVSGTPGELSLFVGGRRPVNVSFAGDTADVSALNGASRGL